ncbi:MAG: FAD:protein FMN transferase [Thermoleophilia bacterium]
MQRHVFPALGTTVDCLVAADGAEAARALLDVEAELARLEALLSRFRPGSQLSELNRAGQLDGAAPELVELVEAALVAREETGGRFDPTVHDALVAAGYDRTFDEVAPDGASGPAGAPCGGPVEVDRAAGRIALAPGSRLDLGGIAKGWAADRACAHLARVGPSLVNAGGDLAARGRPPEGTWPVGVDTPGGELVLGLDGGGLATSGRDRRRWRRDGAERHHLIDPATGRPGEGDLERVTVVAESAARAEVWAKALFLAGERDAAAEADRRGLACVLVTRDGRTVLTGGLA